MTACANEAWLHSLRSRQVCPVHQAGRRSEGGGSVRAGWQCLLSCLFMLNMDSGFWNIFSNWLSCVHREAQGGPSPVGRRSTDGGTGGEWRTRTILVLFAGFCRLFSLM